jgi:PKD repeat protein
MEQCTYGIRGLITNSETNQPVEAKVYIENHDIDESEVYSSASVGDYHRLIKAGTYDVTYSAFGYHEQTIQVTVQDHQATIQNVALEPIQGVLADFHADHTGITPGESINFFDDSFGNVTSWSWSFPGGTPSSSNDQNPQNIQYNETGTFSVTLIIADNEGHSDTLIKESYIVVSNQYTMSNSTVELCNGLFYDTGGENGNYSTDEDFTMTFKPAEEGGKIKADFVEFDVEEQAECNYDYLKIYDGAVQSSNLIGTYCGSTSPGTVEATNDEGILTFVFHSDFSITGTGWKAIMSCTGTSVGVKENHDETIIIYPNPATNSVQIQAQNEIEEISVFDLGGKELEHFYPNGNQYLLNTQHLEKGIYILHIVSDHQLLNKKLIIQ